MTLLPRSGPHLEPTYETVSNCAFCSRSGVIVASDGAFFLRLDDAPLTLGHALICPVGHVPSMADLSPVLADQLGVFLRHTLDACRREFGSLLMFEHGRTAHCVARDPAERFCHHAHLHLVPTGIDLRPFLRAMFRVVGRCDVANLHTVTGIDDGYFFVSHDGEEGDVYRADRPVGSHFLRGRIADELGDPDLADWFELLGAGRSRSFLRLGGQRWQAALSLPDPAAEI